MSRRVKKKAVQTLYSFCDKCRINSELIFSPNRVYGLEGDKKNIMFTHNGNLISYCRLDSFSAQCKVCFNPIMECVYIKDGKYCTVSEHSNVTVIDCAIKKPLQQNEMLIMGTEIGVFIMPITQPNSLQKLLFLRGIIIDYKPIGWVSTIYSQFDRTNGSSADNLMHSIFTGFSDDEENVYLIDRNGNALEYETLLFTGDEYNAPKKDTGYWGMHSADDWKIYANDKMRVKTCGYFKSVEILADIAPAGKHTKPALHIDV